MVENDGARRMAEAVRGVLRALYTTRVEPGEEGVMGTKELEMIDTELKVSDVFNLRPATEGEDVFMRVRGATTVYQLSPAEVRELIQLLEPHAEKV